MNKFIKSIIAATSVTGVVLSSMATAQAHDTRHYHKHTKKTVTKVVKAQPRKRVIRHRHNDAVAWGIIGLATGAFIASSIKPAPKTYVVRPAKPYYPPAPRSYTTTTTTTTTTAALRPWSRGWYNYCNQRYRSFNPNTGTFRGYDGRDHFCVAR